MRCMLETCKDGTTSTYYEQSISVDNDDARWTRRQNEDEQTSTPDVTV